MSGICDTCQRNQVCRRPMDGMDSCRLYVSGTFQYRGEINLQEIVDEQARKLQRNVDEATLEKAADTLANFGYVKADGKSRWFQLFGTPKRAARTMIDTLAACEGPQCTSGRCPFRQLQHCPDYDDYDALLEWLRGEGM